MKEKVAVAMSGGVDSSVAAAILQKQGFEVIGITLKMFASESSKCGGADCTARAASSAAVLGIRHYAKNAASLFASKISGPFALSYMQGATPNPCIECNRWIKFGYLWEIASALSCNYLATGHYAIVHSENNYAGLYRGKDQNKDQSYFLYGIKREILPHIIFPLGNMPKTEVRKLAESFNLPSAHSANSQDICFVPDGYVSYLKDIGLAKKMSGHFVDENGHFLGLHEGFFNYTVGQRRGTGVYGGTRLYVTEIRPEKNEVVLGQLDKAKFSYFTLENLNWLIECQNTEFNSAVQIRYRHKPAPCKVIVKDGKAEVFLEEPQFAVAVGQSAVFYDDSRVLGGGIIKAVKHL